jgi:hypothetical protein
VNTEKMLLCNNLVTRSCCDDSFKSLPHSILVPMQYRAFCHKNDWSSDASAAPVGPPQCIAGVGTRPCPATGAWSELVEQRRQCRSCSTMLAWQAKRTKNLKSVPWRAQALTILNSNLKGFQIIFPANNWSNLQALLEGGFARCSAKGL